MNNVYNAARIAVCLGALFLPLSARGQGTPPAQPPTASSKGEDHSPFKQEELDQMLAPIALYPDSLLSQIFMASTYPLEVVEAARWAKAHKDVKGDAAAKALESEKWDASVKSLVNFPDILAMLSDKLDWTQKIGDAFLGQQKEVMDTVQKLRAKAKEHGTLESSKEQNVKVEQQGSTQTIVIESASPNVIYVPSYNPAVVYGSWWYPAYPPYSYYPPGYVASNVVSFAAGVACGVAWGYAWGHCDWHRCDIDININQNNNFNHFINHNNYNLKGGSWQHDPVHRGGVGYHDTGTARRFGGASATQAAQARNAYRGRAEQGRRDIAGGDADRVRNQPTTRPGEGGSGTRRESSPGNGALHDVDRGGAPAKQQSDRGWKSRGASGARPAGGGRVGGGGGLRRR